MNLLETTYLVLLESKHYCIFFMSVFNPVADSANDDPDHYTFIFLVADSGLRKVERGVGRTGCHVHRENNEVPFFLTLMNKIRKFCMCIVVIHVKLWLRQKRNVKITA